MARHGGPSRLRVAALRLCGTVLLTRLQSPSRDVSVLPAPVGRVGMYRAEIPAIDEAGERPPVFRRTT